MAFEDAQAMNPFDAWLDARDGQALSDAWGALATKQIDLGPAPTGGIGILGWYRTGWAAAQLASVWLGIPLEQLAWLDASDDLESRGAPRPQFEVRRTVELSYLEHEVNERDCHEEWDLREVLAAKRGIQRVYVAWGRSDGSRDGGEGGRGTVVRYFDREKRIGVCVPLYARTVFVIGEVDVDVRVPLDLFDFNPNFRVPAWTTYDLEMVRGLVAQLATEIDAHYDQSASWSKADGSSRFEYGPHAVSLEERRAGDQVEVDVRLEGLPLGYLFRGSLRFTPTTTYGNFNVRLPEEAAMRVLARLRSIDGAELDA